MLVEVKEVKQFENEGFRRWFTDNYFDLIIWYDGDTISGFQLCYDKAHNARALTWEADEGFSHNKIDGADELPGLMKKTPILVPDGIFNKQRIAMLFKKAGKLLETEIFDLIYDKLLEYDNSNVDYIF